jgi:hypothetical protein
LEAVEAMEERDEWSHWRNVRGRFGWVVFSSLIRVVALEVLRPVK